MFIKLERPFEGNTLQQKKLTKLKQRSVILFLKLNYPCKFTSHASKIKGMSAAYCYSQKNAKYSLPFISLV